MWLYPVVLVLVILAIVGATLAGGIFTIVLVPLAVIALISAIVYALWGRALEGSAGANIDASHTTDRPLPHQRRRPSGRSRTSPERLADTRRRQQ
jgi:Na+/H+-dicarboxylate symporter